MKPGVEQTLSQLFVNVRKGPVIATSDASAQGVALDAWPL